MELLGNGDVGKHNFLPHSEMTICSTQMVTAATRCQPDARQQGSQPRPPARDRHAAAAEIGVPFWPWAGASLAPGAPSEAVRPALCVFAVPPDPSLKFVHAEQAPGALS